MLGFLHRASAYICKMGLSRIINFRKSVELILLGCCSMSLCLSGCTEESASYSVTEKHASGTSAMSMARLDVSGMMCAHACGGKIKKELLKVNGVANATIDFKENRKVNFAEVEFDGQMLELERLVKAVAGIAEGKLYTVQAVEVTHFAKRSQLDK